MAAGSKIPDRFRAALNERIRAGRAGNRCECEGRCGTNHGGRCIARHGGIIPSTRGTVVLVVVHVLGCSGSGTCDESHFLALCPGCHDPGGPEHRPQAVPRVSAVDAEAWMTPLFGSQEAA